MTLFEYAPAPESRAVVDLRSSYGLFVGGEFVDPAGGTSFKTINPATEEVLAEVAEAGEADVDLAVRAARRAYDRTWSRMPGRERAKYLFRIARILQERSRELAVLESLDNGKPIRESRDVDVPLAAAWFFYYAGWADKLEYARTGPQAGAPEALGVARPSFDDRRLHELLFRYRARNVPSTLSDDERARWQAHRARRLLDGEGDRPTLDDYLARIDTLALDADDRAQDILGALVDHATELAPSR